MSIFSLKNLPLIVLPFMPDLPAHLVGLFLAPVLLIANLSADPVPVRHPQGSAHGFVVLKTLEGASIATGDMTQVIHGERVTSRLLLRFRDGSIDDDTTVFSQRGVFRLISDHHIQRGPSFPKPIDVLVEATTGRITSHTKDGNLAHQRWQDHAGPPRSPARRVQWPSSQPPHESTSLYA